MTLEMIAFVLLSAGLLGTSAAVLIAKNPIYSALYLILSFFSLAGLYLLLNANFVAIIQVLVYAGAIMVLFLFVIMLLNLSDKELGDSRWNLHKILGVMGGVALFGVLVWAITGAQGRYLGDDAFMRASAVKAFERRVPLPSALEGSTWQGLKADADLAFYQDLRTWKRLNDALAASDPHTACALALPELDVTLRGECRDAKGGSPSGPRCRSLRLVVRAWRAQGCDGALSATNDAVLRDMIRNVLASPQLAAVPAQLDALSAQSEALASMSEAEVAEFYLNFLLVRTLRAEKLRFILGYGNKQLEACARLAKVSPAIDADRCALLSDAAIKHVIACHELENARPLPAQACELLADQEESWRVGAALQPLCSAALALSPDNADACWLLPPFDMAVKDDLNLYTARCDAAIQQLNALPIPRCTALRGAFFADAVAAADAATADMGRRLAAIEAALDPSPIPGTWRGDDAFRRPASGLSRYEQAVVDAVGVFYARDLHAALDAATLDPERLAQTASQPLTDKLTDPKDAQRGAFNLAQRRYALLMDAHGQPTTLKATFEAIEAAYLSDTKRVIAALRDNKPSVITALLRDRLEAHGPALNDADRAHALATLRALTSTHGGRYITHNPVIIDEDDFGSIRAVGRDLFTKLLLPFEVTSVLLLAAIMGAVVIAKRRSS